MGDSENAPCLRRVEAFPATVEGREVICLRDPSGVTDVVLTVSRPAVEILALLDGTRSLLDIQADIMRRYGTLVPRGQLEALVETLDRHFFLEGPRLEAERGGVDGFFAAVARDGDSRRICGLSPIYALLRTLPTAEGRLLHYGQWPDPQGAVTFASVAFVEDAP